MWRQYLLPKCSGVEIQSGSNTVNSLHCEHNTHPVWFTRRWQHLLVAWVHKLDCFLKYSIISILTSGTLWFCGSPSVFTPLQQIQGGVVHWTYCSRLTVWRFPLDWIRSPVGRLAPDQWVKAAWGVHLRASQGVTTPVCEGLRGTQEKLILIWICLLITIQSSMIPCKYFVLCIYFHVSCGWFVSIYSQ